jgi:hypothetical protein
VRNFNWRRRNVQSMAEAQLGLETLGRVLVFLVGTFGFVYFWWVW